MSSIRIVFLIGTVSLWHSLFCQVTTEPAVPTADNEIRIIYDATQGTTELEGADKVYMHAGAILSSSSGTGWDVIIGNWGVDDGIGEMTKVEGETDKWEITLSPRDYFSVPTDPIYRIGMVFRNADGSDEGKTDANGDIFVDLLQGGYGTLLLSPSSNTFFVNTNDEIDIEIAASETSDFELLVNEVSTDTQSGLTTYTYTHAVTETTGTSTLAITATNGVETDEVTITYTIAENSPTAELPAGLVRGINYDEGDPTYVYLVLEAPLKSSVYVVGEFNDWEISSDFLMNKDGELFWLEITGLESGVEYGFQYLVDETIYVADPYADKILDPGDGFISDSIYPNLKEYPGEAMRDDPNHQRVSVLQTGQTSFDWQVDNFEKPSKDELVIYEVLIRDYFASGQRTYKNLMDTLSYLKKLGINAIELMPITDFKATESWGYDPVYMFAPDKSFGSKDDLKSLIDAAHEQGIAVILDIVMNHQDIPGTYAIMYWDNGITAENPWFNQTAKHPFNVFFDFNHESSYTQHYLDSVNLYWLEEYKFDGFRFDLSKGFTQNDTGDDVGAWSAYDQSRIDLLKRMSDAIWDHTPDAYVILEHFGDNSEETELADYGMMLWGGMHHAYGQLAMGYASESSINGVAASERGWTNNNLVSYMESHDEERMMYKCQEFGNENSSYSTKDEETALERVMAASSFFYTVPGPKMLWEYGELGFDYSINRCTDGSIDEDCRLAIKPTWWEYLESEPHLRLFEVTQELISLKTSYTLFQSGEVSFFNSSNLSRYVWVTQNDIENPTDPSEMNAIIIGNFDITQKDLDVTFPHTGTWYHYFDLGDPIEIFGTTTITLQPGEFRVYTDVELDPTNPELMSNLKPLAPTSLSFSDEEDGIVLEWEDQSRINTGFHIYRKSSDTDWELVGTVSDINTYTDKAILPEETYDYQVAAFNAVGERTSPEISATSTNFVLGLNDLDSEIIYPNPASDVLFIQGVSSLMQIQIIDSEGKHIVLPYQTSSGEMELDVSALPIGMYFIRLFLNSQTRNLRFIKN